MFCCKIILMGAFLFGGVSSAQAKTYYLPDYQQEFIYGGRVSDSDTGHTSKSSCSTYGHYSASTRPANMDCARTKDPVPGLTCYTCSCSSSYVYNSSNCSGDKTPVGSSCGGKWNGCSCNTSIFHYTSGNCTAPNQPSGASCSDGTTRYKECIDTTPCSGGGYSETEKSSWQSRGYICTYSYAGYKTGCYTCSDPCASYAGYPNAGECVFGCRQLADGCPTKCFGGCYTDSCNMPENAGYPNSCERGCDYRGAVANCPSKCYGCKTCITCDAAYNLGSCPTGVTCESCTGCDGVRYKALCSLCEASYNLSSCPTGVRCTSCSGCAGVKYQAVGCAVGYQEYQTTDCVALGYTATRCTSGNAEMPCPFNSAYKFCYTAKW